MTEDDKPEPKRILQGHLRQEDSGILLPNDNAGKKVSGARDRPFYFGELKFDLRNIDKLVSAEGLMRIYGWKHIKDNRWGKPVEFVKLRISWWKAGDLTRTQIQTGHDAGEDEWILPE